ncbi:hypothetical protein ACHHYP_12284 [Achlya hypogyna]|uniref:Uncharacterized protein n=1 Tax=Achlya hypogyna TaxID=1202772 RepID=A0A1V9YH98_ACHHY|nr:hypothetical protein ACHHYP_12284 [Achlya hypogyna]
MEVNSEHKQLRGRLKQQRRHARDVAERDALRRQIYLLRQFIARYKPQAATALPWKTVADALHEATAEAETENGQLRLRLRHLHDVSTSLSLWATAVERSHNIPDAAEPFGWRHHVVPSNTVARRLALDWFSKQLFYNTDRIMAYALFPTSSPVFDHLDVACDDFLDSMVRIQVDVDLPLGTTLAITRANVWAYMQATDMPVAFQVLDPTITQDIDPALLFARYSRGDDVNFAVMREFVTANRVVFVSGNFRQDEANPTYGPWRSRLFWLTMDRLENDTTRLRVLNYNSPYEIGGQRLTWRDEQQHFAVESASSSDQRASYIKIIESYAREYLQQQWHLLGFNLLPLVPTS